MPHNRKIPNLFIVGAARSGTTSLWRDLKGHPAIFMPGDLLSKEPAYFSELKRSRFKTPDKYGELFAGAGEEHQWVGEASTAYLTDPTAARRIYEYNPDAKIIIILRNPVSRAYSLYNWMTQEGYEYARTFTEALALEAERIHKKIPNYYEPEYYYNYLYFRSGLYYEQVRRYMELFKENLVIIKFEDYTGDFDRIWHQLCNFLDIDSSVPSAGHSRNVDHQYTNASWRPWSPPLQFILRKMTKFCLRNREKIRVIIENKDHKQGNKALNSFIFNEAQVEISALAKVKKTGPIVRFRLHQLLTLMVRELYSGAWVPNREIKQERDRFIEMAPRAGKPAALDENTKTYLKKQYREDAAKLSDLTGLGFSSWGI